MTTKTWGRNMGRLGIDSSQTGLVAGYNMVPRADGTIEDLSGNGNHGTINGPGFEYTEIGPSMRFAGNSEYVETLYTGSPSAFTICGWFNAKGLGESNNGRLFGKGLGTLELFINNSTTNMNLRYENGSGTQNLILNNIYSQNQTFHLCITHESGVIKIYKDSGEFSSTSDSIVLDSSTLVIGNYNPLVRAFDGNIANFQFFERALTSSEIQAEYLRGASAVNFKTDYGVTTTVTPDTSGELANSPFRVESGSFDISTDTINGCEAKVIECVSAGVCHIPTAYFHGNDTQGAYGTWEWLFNKVGAATQLRIPFIGNQGASASTAGFNGYELRIESDESLRLIRFTNGTVAALLYNSGASAIGINTWYDLKITRSSDGEITTYLDGALLDVSGGAGTNPVTDNTYTESKYLVFELDAGDKVAYATKNGECSIVKYQGVV
jgi:hypothetical protein